VVITLGLENAILRNCIMCDLSEVSIGFADPSQAAIVARLVRAMDRHYRPGEDLLPETEYLAMVTRTTERQEGTRFVVAQAPGNRPVGLACVAIIRPGRDLKGLIYLKDLFVMAEARGLGIGSRLMRFLAAFATANGIARIDFTTDRANLSAQRLYAALGAVVQEKVFYTLPADALRRLTEDPPAG
jgi:ribosomal protein S18 acetylase RimI-like enzyme